MPQLRRGDLLPRIVTPPPGPRSRRLAEKLRRFEAPGINTLVPGPRGPRPSIAWEEALGANVLDVDGNRYLDLTSGFGVAAIGHRHPRVVEAVRRQSRRLLHGLGDVHPHPLRAELAQRLCTLAPVDEPRVYFGISGSEAVEIALKTAFLATGRSGVVAFDPCYHGLTLGSLAATSRAGFRRPFEAWLGVPVERVPYGGDLGQLDAALATGEVGAVLFEPVVGREGVVFPPSGWLREVASRARRSGAVVISDEVFVGFGRTGFWFGVVAEGLRPDLLVCGKALGGGSPIAAVVGRRTLMESWQTPGEALHTATFVAQPLACATALATLEVLEEDDLPARARELGSVVAARLEPWGRYPAVSSVRGRGLLWALEMADAAGAKALARNLLERGVLALAGGPEGRVLQLTPPLTISQRQLDAALDLLTDALETLPGA